MPKNIVKKALHIAPYIKGKAADLGSEDVNWQDCLHFYLEKFSKTKILRVDQMGEPEVKADLNKKFPFKDGTFDTLIASEIIEHMDNPYHFLSECKRILKDDGRILLTTPNAISISEWSVARSTIHHDKPYPEHIYNWHKRNMSDLALKVGLQVRKFDYISYYWKRNYLFRFIAWIVPFLRPTMFVILKKDLPQPKQSSKK